MDIVRCAWWQHLAPPKIVDPVTASRPEGARPVTEMVAGLSGSSLVTVIIAAFGPKPVGSKRMATGTASPGPIVMGNDNTSGTRNSPEDELMPVTVNVHLPLLARTNGSSTNECTQQLAKVPAIGDR